MVSDALRGYLRGAPPRPNPESGGDDRADGQLSSLPWGETSWRPMPGRWTRATARDEMGAPLFEGGFGDLVSLADGDGRVDAVWVCGPSGFVEPRLLGDNLMDPDVGWYGTWHDPDARPGFLLQVAVVAGVDRRRVILALAGIVEVALGRAPRLPEGRRVVAAAAVAWAEGHGPEGAVRAALEDAEAAAERAVGAENPMRNLVIEVECSLVKTAAGGDFTKHRWQEGDGSQKAAVLGGAAPAPKAAAADQLPPGWTRRADGTFVPPAGA